MTMSKASLAFTLVAAAFVGAIASPAQAQRVFVSAQGSDGNPCSFALPCRTFQHAHDVVAAGGEIDVLDPAGYGPLTIAKSISIQGHGFSGISVPSGSDGITINGGATDVVSLNGLIIDGNGAGLTGIVFNSGSALVVENCVVRRMAHSGLYFTSTATTARTLDVSKCTFAHNHDDGINITSWSSGAMDASIDRVAFYGNANGLQAIGSNGTAAITVSVTDSVATHTASVGGPIRDAGFLVDSDTAGSPVTLVLTRCTVSGNYIGIQANLFAKIRLAQSTIANNRYGHVSLGSSSNIYSFGDNYITDNSQNIGSLTSATKQ
jgi:hypothetical protein